MSGDGGAGAPYVPGSDTSREAAESVAPISSGIRAQVFEWVRGRGREGATCDEVEAALGLRHQTASARVRELVKAGALVDSGQRRRTRSGRTARVVAIPVPGSLRRPLLRSRDLGDATPGTEEEVVASGALRRGDRLRERLRERARELREARVTDPSRLDDQQRRVLEVIARVGDLGATCDEVEIVLDLSHQCASARLRELIRKGLAEDSGERRQTRSGRSARVVVVVDPWAGLMDGPEMMALEDEGEEGE